MDIHVPNEKAGLLIGEGGETIELLETKSGAGIQDSAMTICMDVFIHPQMRRLGCSLGREVRPLSFRN